MVENHRTRVSITRQSRHGLTLFELIMVLVIIVLVAAMSIPALQGAFKTQRLKKSGDLVRAEWQRAKINAMRHGEEFAFFYEPETGRYWIAPFSSVYSNQGGASGPEEAVGNYDYGNGYLPRGVYFDSGQSIEDERTALLAEEEGGAGSLNNMILFYPDGTSQDAELYLRNEDDAYIRVHVRALTGVTTVSEVLATADEDSEGS